MKNNKKMWARIIVACIAIIAATYKTDAGMD